MELEIKTLTPLWTGGANAGQVDRIHETGLLGSLRWWYEALVRGLGGEVCDPTSPTCIYDSDRPNNGLCDVCQVFGATGWRRRFRFLVEERKITNASIQHTVRLENCAYEDSNTPKTGNLTIRIHGLAHDAPFDKVIGGLLQFVADWTALGARAQMGFGVVELGNGRFNAQPLYDQLVATAGSRKYLDCPSLQNVFLAQVKPKEGNTFSEQSTFSLKYDLRQLFSGGQDKDLRHFIMGTGKDGRMAAKIKMSRPYGDGLMRVWGWIPEKATAYTTKWNRDAVVKAIYDHLKANYTLQVWREMKSPRDTVTPSNGDTQAFLQSLLVIEEKGHAA